MTHSAPLFTETPHLSASQLDDALIGDLAPSASAHLAACGLCADRLAEARAPLAGFAAVALAWSERRSATLPLRPDAGRISRHASPLSWAHLTIAGVASAALALAIALPALHLAPVAAPTTASSVAQDSTDVSNASTPREEQISRDNQMLRAIDRELDASTQSSLVGPASFTLSRESGSSRSLTPSLQD